MLKIFCLLAALLVSAACKIDRPNRVVEEKKVVDRIAKEGIDILKLPPKSMLIQVIDPETAEKMGFNRQTIYVVRKRDGSQRVMYMQYYGDLYGWFYVMHIDESY